MSKVTGRVFNGRGVTQVCAAWRALQKTPVCKFDEVGVEFDADVPAAMLYRYDARRCGSGKRVEHDSTFGTSSQHARFRQVRWKHCEVSTVERLCRHHPDGAFIASVTIWRKPTAPILLGIANWSTA